MVAQRRGQFAREPGPLPVDRDQPTASRPPRSRQLKLEEVLQDRLDMAFHRVALSSDQVLHLLSQVFEIEFVEPLGAKKRAAWRSAQSAKSLSYRSLVEGRAMTLAMESSSVRDGGGAVLVDQLAARETFERERGVDRVRLALGHGPGEHMPGARGRLEAAGAPAAVDEHVRNRR
jgi:hypothetical protein